MANGATNHVTWQKTLKPVHGVKPYAVRGSFWVGEGLPTPGAHFGSGFLMFNTSRILSQSASVLIPSMT